MPKKQEAKWDDLLTSDAHKVRAMMESSGWQIIRRDALNTLKAINRSWMFYPNDAKEYENLRITALGIQMMLDLVEHYETTRLKIESEILKSLDLKNRIQYDVDNESPLIEEET